LTSGIYLRNELAPPVSNFTVTQIAVSSTVRDLQLNGSASSDPNGQALTYQWFDGGSCPSPSGAITGATAQQTDAGNFNTNQTVTFSLVVTNTGGLSNCASQAVPIQ
jgi:hypothetical protein